MTGVDMDGAAALRAEWRAAEEEWSRAALERWEHGRTLADVVRDCLGRGDVVSFVFPATTWTGALVAVGSDIARVALAPGLVDVRLGATAPFVLRSRPDRPSDAVADHRPAEVTTFTARVRELDGTPVCIGTATGPLEGMMRAGRDQLRLSAGDGACAYVPSGSVWWVRPLDDD